MAQEVTLQDKVKPYEKWRGEFLFYRISIAAWICLVADLVLALVDRVLYPDYAAALVYPRVIFAIAVIFSILIAWVRPSRLRPLFLAVFFYIAVGVTLVDMTRILGGFISPYYAGLLLLFLGVAVVAPIMWPLHIICQSFIFLSYIGINSINPLDSAQINGLINNASFLLVGIAITSISVSLYERLQLSQFNFQKKLEEAYGKLQTVNERLEEMNQLKAEFFANITHEFRTPLTLIIGPMESALSGQYGKFRKSFGRQLEIMTRNARRLLHLINQLLDLSKLESGKTQLNTRHFDLIGVLKYIVSSFEPIAVKKEIQLSLKTEVNPLPITADPEKIEKIVYNLLSNAFKFTEAGGRIEVDVSSPFANVAAEDKPIGNLLLVSDDKTVLKKWRHSFGWMQATHLVESADQAHELIEAYRFKCVILNMDASLEAETALLAQVADATPESYRILLTDGSNREMIVHAVNRVHVHALFYKPWSEADCAALVLEAFEQRRWESSEPEEMVTIEVRDTGRGIPEKDIPYIFDRFRQVDGSQTRDQEGTGIGLSIVKEFVDLHKGRIHVESSPGQGAGFTIQMPLDQVDVNLGFLEKPHEDGIVRGQLESITSTGENEPLEIHESAGMETGAGRGTLNTKDVEFSVISNLNLETEGGEGVPDESQQKILIVEDNSDMRAYIKEVLKDRYQLFMAANGEEGLRRANEVMPDLILSDVMMPKMDGYQLLQAIKDNEKTRNIPVIILTAKFSEDLKIKGLEQGADDYLSKPFNHRELVARIENLLKLKQALTAVEKLKDKAEASTKAKSAFLANMSHEIRTPMNAILGFTELLENKIENSQQKQYLSAVSSSGKTLLTIINDILDLSKIEAGKLELRYKPIRPGVILNEINQMFSRKVSDKGLAFKVNIDPSLPEKVLLDEVRLRQILLNLVGNSVKFTRKGYVKLGLHQLRSTGAEGTVGLAFSVQDTGIGIAEDQRALIFESFKQQDGQSTEEYGGTGLGLSITKRLVEMMGGDISVESDPGKGSTFTIALREVAVSADQEGFKGHSGPDLENIKFHHASILIADNVEYNRLLLKGFINSSQIKVYEAENGKEAIDCARLYKPDLILTGMKMPVMDGYEITRKIKQEKGLKSIPVIAITASVMTGEERRIREAGCDGLIRKPFNKTDLLTELMRHLPYSEEGPETRTESDKKGDRGHQAPVSLTPGARAKLPELLHALEKNEMPDWKRIQGTFVISEIEGFADRIRGLGNEYEIEAMTDWGDALSQQSKNFDMERMVETLKNFPELVEKINAFTDI